MKNKSVKVCIAGSKPVSTLAIILGSTLLLASPAVSSAPYWTDSDGAIVHDGFGGCVRTIDWTEADALPECEGQPAAPKPEVKASEPVPLAAPVAPAAPVVLHKVSLDAEALFDVNSAEIKPAAKASLDKLVTTLKQFRRADQFVLTGHTDSTGSAAYNQRLSERRAEAVKAYLVEHGIPAEMITAEGQGESEPVASNATREGRQQNRRVEIRVIAEQ